MMLQNVIIIFIMRGNIAHEVLTPGCGERNRTLIERVCGREDSVSIGISHLRSSAILHRLAKTYQGFAERLFF